MISRLQFWLLLLFVTISSVCISQYAVQSTILEGDDTYNSINIKTATDYNENLFVLKYSFLEDDNYYSLIKLTPELDEVKKIDPIEFQYESMWVSDMIYTDNGLLLISLEKNNGTTFLNTYLIGTNLSSIIQIASNQLIGSGIDPLHFNYIDDKLVGIGNVIDENYSFKGIAYYEYSITTNTVTNVIEIPNSEVNSYMTGVFYNNENKTYLITYINGVALILDSEFEVINTTQSRFVYSQGDATVVDLIYIGYCDLNTEVPFCIGSGISGNQFELLVSNSLDFDQDYYISSAEGFYNGEDSNLVQFDLEVNNNNHKLVYLTGFHNFFNTSVEENNIYFYIFDESNELIFETVFNNESEIYLRDISFRDNGDFYVVGEQILSSSDDFFTRNIIISFEKETSSTNSLSQKEGDIRVFPNPTTDYVEVEMDEEVEYTILYDSFGQKIEQIQLINGKGRIDMTSLASGVYFLQFIDSENIYTYSHPIIRN